MEPDEKLPDGERRESIEDAWCREIERRASELNCGTAETIPWESVRAVYMQDVTHIRSLSTRMGMEFEFGLRFQIDADADLAGIIDRLAAAGCDDAVVGIGRPGRLALEFARRGVTVENAIRDALMDVLRAVPGARLIQISRPDNTSIS